jgi:hypothetical protein
LPLLKPFGPDIGPSGTSVALQRMSQGRERIAIAVKK